MENYDPFLEMSGIDNKIIIGVMEPNVELVKGLLKYDFVELILFRDGYDLSLYSEDYIQVTSKLFCYYFDSSNTDNYEAIRLKKFFTQFKRQPKVVYVNNKIDNYLIKPLKELDIMITYSQEEIFKILEGV